MPYVTRSGELVETQPWNVKYVKQVILRIFHILILFFQTLFPLDLFRDSSSNQRSNWGGGPPRPPGRGFGRPCGGGGPDAPPMVGGGG
ncbi:unnamed protein product [Dicrocoelium dendriticum]|nr:unnamed protein product [Dicrocoelium dendriticum]